MVRYEFRQDGVQHGWLSVFDAEGNLLGTVERHWTVEDKEIHTLESHECIPGQMIPMGDPRWYTYCQECGESVVGQETAYSVGQYHYPNCYQHELKRMQAR